MIDFKPLHKKINTGDLRTPISFYAYQPSSGFEPGETEKKTLFRCWAKVDKVWMRDLEMAKQNGTLEDLTVTIRDPGRDFLPSNKHYIGIQDQAYKGKRYAVESVQPDTKNVGFIIIVAKLVTS